MHRQRTRLAARAPARARPVAAAVERSGIVATYTLHDRLLSNRASRRLYADNPPALDALQERALAALASDGYVTLEFEQLLADPSLHDAVVAKGEAFIAETERALAREAEGRADTELRRRAGKEFLVREHSFDGVRLGLDHPWFRACLSQRMLDLANSYLRMWSKLSYVDLWYTVPQAHVAERVASQLWHYDFDDKHLLKAFLYLGDVDASSGPFEYVAKSQPGGRHHAVRPWKPMGYGRVSDQVAEKIPVESIRTFTAPKGTLILCNTSGLHRGGFATERPRILATATYCSPASLVALSRRNFEIEAGGVATLGPAATFAVS